MKIEIRLGDCLDVMKEIPSNSVDLVLTDPPYGIEFMGREWDKIPDMGGFSFQWLEEALRILKPGGVVKSFGATRTFHRLAKAMSMVGFQDLSLDAWIYGSGFPKSHNISKALDKIAGVERTQVIGERHQNVKPFDDGSGWNPNNTTGDHQYLAPATEEAKTWKGWGTALKPAFEPIVVATKGTGNKVPSSKNLIITLARKPLSEPTISLNVLRWGTGAINIDACRIGDGNDRTEGGKGSEKTPFLTPAEEKKYERPTGSRWPANLILAHLPGCVVVGGKDVVKSGGGSSVLWSHYRDGKDEEKKSDKKGYREENQKEKFLLWGCEEGCPVKEIGGQSGDRPSTWTNAIVKTKSSSVSSSNYRPNQGEYQKQGPLYEDQGTASRFFLNVQEKEGRWPANLILSHLPSCKRTGTKEIGTGNPGGYSYQGNEYEVEGFVKSCKPQAPSNYGKETVEMWDCDGGCPVKEMDMQGGIRKSGSNNTRRREGYFGAGSERHGGLGSSGDVQTSYGDEGTASRFFLKTTGKETLLDYLKSLILPSGGLYVTEVTQLNTCEENSIHGMILEGDITPYLSLVWEKMCPGGHLLLLGTEEDPLHFETTCNVEDRGFEVRDALLLLREGSHFYYVPKAASSEKSEGLEGKNPHPTVKPIGIMERLLDDVPEGSLVVDPFAGSGTTGIACLKKNMRGFLVEKEEVSWGVANKRISFWRKKIGKKNNTVLDLFSS